MTSIQLLLPSAGCLFPACTHADSLLGDGCRVMEGSVVKNSVLGSCTYIDQHCYIQVRPCWHSIQP
jgi:ADP-glucose pyrophosphorylase